jgi:hypothetical protein
MEASIDPSMVEASFSTMNQLIEAAVHTVYAVDLRESGR